MKAFLDYLCELSASDSPKYSCIETDSTYIHVMKKIIGKRVGEQKLGFSDTIHILEYFRKCNEWRSFYTNTSGAKNYFVRWFLQVNVEKLSWRFV